MPNFTTTQDGQRLRVCTPELDLHFSLEDGSLCGLWRKNGLHILGHANAQPTVDVRVGIDGTWLADRVFVRYLRHTVSEQHNAVDIAVVIGVGPLVLTDCYRVTGTLVARTLTVENVSEDDIRLCGVRLLVPSARIGDPDVCRFEAPGSLVRPHIALSVAASQRRGVLPRRFFAPGLHQGRTLEPAPSGGAGLIGIADPQSNETLLCWYASDDEAAIPTVEGNDTSVTLTYQVGVACYLHANQRVQIGTQYLLCVREPWPAALASYQRTQALLGQVHPASSEPWLRDAALYEVHAAHYGGFSGLAAHFDALRKLGITTLCLLPFWSFENTTGHPWDENWEASGNPYLICDFEQLDGTLGTVDDIRALCVAAHHRGMRVIADLPMIGCPPNARYVHEHPSWFCGDEEQPAARLESSTVALFDWSNAELRDYWLLHAVAHARDLGLDGYRLMLPEVLAEHWVQHATHRASAGSTMLPALVDELRMSLRRHRPDAVVLVNRAGPTYTSRADMVFDIAAHYEFMHTMFNRLSPHELGLWLEDAARVNNGATVRAGFVESYRTWMINPLADGMRGSLLSRLALTGLVCAGFVPCIRAGQEECDEEYTTRLLQARAANPVLRAGATRYNAVPCDDPQLFTIIRTLGETHVLCLLKIGARKQTVTLSVPVDQLGLADGSYRLMDIIRGQPLIARGRSTWAREELLSFQLTLAPYESLLLIIEPTPADQTTNVEPPYALPRPRLGARQPLLLLDPAIIRDIDE